MAQTLSEIKTLLAAHGLRPKHKFGQNFLHDGNHMRRIMDAADLQAGDVVLEVGPGTGALTERLLEVGAEVVAVEIDTDLEPVLTHRMAGLPDGQGDRFTLVVGDALAGKHTINPAVIEPTMARVASSGRESFKLIANLPYHVASPLMANLAVDHPAMSDAVVMIQKEVADRLEAKPGSKAYGPLGILIQTLCEVRTVGTLAPGCFWPPPKVASTVVHLKRRPQPLTDDPKAFSATLKTLFTKRRKQLGSILGRDTELPEGISHDTRPDALTVEQLIALAEMLGSDIK
ncbi:16S rRNA (adenine(1518)-N(6)/adenine(1519)-N(6))-dimethyltransferase RsmA [Algisphaera agarilytica]|uniref:Ribosomal RNA small subunit methyltransferase A n=1 Tax=Algisphaera agarilytica TaxID=1385975 RepID=A0A7X0H6P1_9BACT|nr:16S rRNA (adenine(1518)-N(6)/adenine(1519)-N(6))-dimethyltransferase RsmA [Algisphaera agarilytica]MBB6428800.1 16S rRNA (adenine1518-N6/adenine1519-N6)-dimethyltransferase [Algisphaera agarilytica]